MSTGFARRLLKVEPVPGLVINLQANGCSNVCHAYLSLIGMCQAYNLLRQLELRVNLMGIVHHMFLDPPSTFRNSKTKQAHIHTHTYSGICLPTQGGTQSNQFCVKSLARARARDRGLGAGGDARRGPGGLVGERSRRTRRYVGGGARQKAGQVAGARALGVVALGPRAAPPHLHLA